MKEIYEWKKLVYSYEKVVMEKITEMSLLGEGVWREQKRNETSAVREKRMNRMVRSEEVGCVEGVQG